MHRHMCMTGMADADSIPFGLLCPLGLQGAATIAPPCPKHVTLDSEHRYAKLRSKGRAVSYLFPVSLLLLHLLAKMRVAIQTACPCRSTGRPAAPFRGTSSSQTSSRQLAAASMRSQCQDTVEVGSVNGIDAAASSPRGSSAVDASSRRAFILGSTAAMAAPLVMRAQPAKADDFVTLPTGLKVLTIRPGEGASPQPGDTVVVHWAGYTKGYQGKRIDNTSTRDEPYEFVLGAGQAIPAFEQAVTNMKVGGISRVEVPGEHPELSYPLDRGQRFTGELISSDLKIYKYRYGPQPVDLGGQRALDFVLDNATLRDFNRTLLFDIKLLAVRKPRA